MLTRTPHHGLIRMLLACMSAFLAFPSMAAEGTPSALEHPMAPAYILGILAFVQTIVIVVVASAIKGISAKGGIMERYLKERREHSLPLLALATPSLAMTISYDNLMWLLVVLNLFLFFYSLLLIWTLRSLITTLNGPKAEAESLKEHKPSLNIELALTKAVPVEREDEVMLDHDYDGIRELDNVLPPWWLWMFYATIVFAVVYVLNYHVFRIAPLQQEEFRIEMAEGEAEVKAYVERLGGLVTEESVTIMTDGVDLTAGKSIFMDNCVTCHAETGAGYPGSVGPNLVDPYWLHGGGIVNVFKTIKYGVPEKGMISWQAQLKPKQIQQVSSFILSLQGTVTEGGKEPQGTIWTDEGALDVEPDSISVAPGVVVEVPPE